MRLKTLTSIVKNTQMEIDNEENWLFLHAYELMCVCVCLYMHVCILR